MNYRDENIIEISWKIYEMISAGKIERGVLCDAELKQLIIKLADQFEFIHSETNWNEEEYIDTIGKYCEVKFADAVLDAQF